MAHFASTLVGLAWLGLSCTYQNVSDTPFPASPWYCIEPQEPVLDPFAPSPSPLIGVAGTGAGGSNATAAGGAAAAGGLGLGLGLGGATPPPVSAPQAFTAFEKDGLVVRFELSKPSAPVDLSITHVKATFRNTGDG